jgi:hypothetical protein
MQFVGRLTRSLPLSRPDGLPVCVAGVLPLHSVKRLGRRLTQNPPAIDVAPGRRRASRTVFALVEEQENGQPLL